MFVIYVVLMEKNGIIYFIYYREYVQEFQNEEKQKTNTSTRGSRLQANMKMFEGFAQKQNTETPKVNKLHQNTITEIQGKTVSNGSFIEFTSAGLDGKLCVWSTHSLPKDIQTKYYID